MAPNVLRRLMSFPPDQLKASFGSGGIAFRPFGRPLLPAGYPMSMWAKATRVHVTMQSIEAAARSLAPASALIDGQVRLAATLRAAKGLAARYAKRRRIQC